MQPQWPSLDSLGQPRGYPVTEARLPGEARDPPSSSQPQLAGADQLGSSEPAQCRKAQAEKLPHTEHVTKVLRNLRHKVFLLENYFFVCT